MTAWSERNPNPQSNILRDDGRVCFYVRRKGIVVSTRTKRTKLVLETACGDLISPRTLPGMVLFPVTTTEPLSCPKCVGIQETKHAPPPEPYNPLG